jgi:hypothetical protein
VTERHWFVVAVTMTASVVTVSFILPGRYLEADTAATTIMFARHGLVWSRLRAGREWDRLNSLP